MRRALAHQRAEVELGLRAAADADHRDPAAGRERGDVAGHVRAADELEDDVERAVLLEALGVDRLDVERVDARAQLGVADGGGDARAGHLAELHGGHADAARAAVHEQPLAGAQPGLGEERVVGGREDLGHAAGGVPVELRGIGIAVRSWTTASSAWPPPATIDITRSPGSKRCTPGPHSTTSPASSSPGMSCGAPGGAG